MVRRRNQRQSAGRNPLGARFSARTQPPADSRIFAARAKWTLASSPEERSRVTKNGSNMRDNSISGIAPEEFEKVVTESLPDPSQVIETTDPDSLYSIVAFKSSVKACAVRGPFTRAYNGGAVFV